MLQVFGTITVSDGILIKTQAMKYSLVSREVIAVSIETVCQAQQMDGLIANGNRYPENTNRIRLKFGFRTGNHTGSSVPVTAEGAGALLFYGYYDQTDLFFKMAKVLTINTQTLNAAVNAKRIADVPYPNVEPQLLTEKKGSNVIMLKNAPLVTPRLRKEGETYCMDEDHDH